MSLRLLDDVRTLDAASRSRGDVLVYCDTPRGELAAVQVAELPWVVARVKAVGEREVLARFARRPDAICFTLAYCAHGWPNSDVLRDAAHAVISARHTAQLEDRLSDLAAALGAVAPPPRVLIVVDCGVARAYATPGVLVATADLDSKRLFSTQDLAPIHTDFSELLEHAGVRWPLSPWGRKQSAAVVNDLQAQPHWQAANEPCLLS
jgi:hypothetical protein